MLERMELQKLSFITGENANSAATLEDSLAVSYKTKHHFSVSYAP